MKTKNLFIDIYYDYMLLSTTYIPFPRHLISFSCSHVGFYKIWLLMILQKRHPMLKQFEMIV
ncbi:hypothetical protein ACJIZ3_015288 [Penstemon smallii]|uniref:Uncharacterized protein n=1 Tax=Penstemon smallii TaxID=265156 RepID=A0ABD3RUM9_9LAMI